MSGPPDARRDAGFTLLEIVVALAVLGILLATLTQGVRFGLAAFDRQDRMVATGSRLEAVDRTLRRLIEQLDPGTTTDGDTVVGTHHGLAFRSSLPMSVSAAVPGQPDGSPTDGPADLRLSIDHEHRLILDWLPHRHAVPTGPTPPPHVETLLTGLERLDISYYGDGIWLNEWSQNKPPRLIRIRLVFPDGDPRHWPDLVAAPARDQAGD